MSDRAEREKQLDWLYRLKSNLKIFIPKDFHLAEFEQSLDYAISSIKTDLKYDLLYEETNHIANVSKKIESTPNDCETCIHNKGVLECDMYGCKYESTTKNCRTCRNFGSHHGICEICKDNKCWTEIEPTTKNDLADGKDNNVTSKEDTISRQEAIDTIRQLYIDLATQKYVIDLLKVLPSVTPQEPIDYKAQYENYLKKSEVVISQLRADRDRLQDAFDKLRAEIKELPTYFHEMLILDEVIQIIDKYRAETEEENVSL